jgi:hypothetical protein
MTRRGTTVLQPIPFSHKHHVRGLGLDCRYCHATVETSSEAGYPPTRTCMTCHSQIWTHAPILLPLRRSLATGTPIRWNRVAAVPDYVYFRHDIHIAKGVGCVTCHGRVDLMPLTYRAVAFQMSFCVSCHRNPGPRLRPEDRVFDLAWQPPSDPAYGKSLIRHYGIDAGRLTECYVCHR